MKPPEQFFVVKAAAINAMKSLLAVSSTAKSAALEGILIGRLGALF
jgi:hypothetical protein